LKKILSVVIIGLLCLSMLSIHTMAQVTTQPAITWNNPKPFTSDAPIDVWPAILQDRSDKIWLVWGRYTSSGYYSSLDILYSTSTDFGNTWSGPKILVTGLINVERISLLQDSMGTLWVAWSATTQYGGGPSAIYITQSSDNGATWAQPRMLFSGHQVGLPSLVETPSGILLFFRPYPNVAYSITGDFGATWSAPTVIASPPYGENHSPSAMRDSSGRIWLAFNRYVGGQYQGPVDIYYKTSDDEGTTWSLEQQATAMEGTYWAERPIFLEYQREIYLFFQRWVRLDGGPTPLYNVTYIKYGTGGWTVPVDIAGTTSYYFMHEDMGLAEVDNMVWVAWDYSPGSYFATSSDIWYMTGITAGAPPPSIVSATVDIDPDTLNLKSNGEFVTVYIELPNGYNVADIDLTTVQLEGISAITDPQYGFVTDPAAYLVDHDGDGIMERMVKFDRATVQTYLTNEPDYESAPKFYDLRLTVTGELLDGTPFEGTDTITVIRQ